MLSAAPTELEALFGTVWTSERDPLIEAVAVCVVRHAWSPEVLAVPRREDPAVLCMPGGKVERDETPRMAAVRELREETGAVVRARDLVWLGAIEETSRSGGTVIVGAFWALAPCVYEPTWSLGEPGCSPRWHEWADLADESKFGRFARVAMFTRVARGVSR